MKLHLFLFLFLLALPRFQDEIANDEDDKGENFGVDDPVTREQMAVFLYTYAKSVGKIAGEADLSKLDAFSDADEVSGYAKEAVAWLVGEGLMAGRGSGKLAPGESSTRAEVAAFLVSCYEYLSK